MSRARTHASRHAPGKLLAQIPGILQETFGPLDRILALMHYGPLLTHDGVAVFRPKPRVDRYHPVGEALRGFVITFEAFGERTGRAVDTSPLARLADIADRCELASVDVLNACRACASDLRGRAATMRWDEAQSLLLGTKIKAEIEAKQSQRAAS